MRKLTLLIILLTALCILGVACTIKDNNKTKARPVSTNSTATSVVISTPTAIPTPLICPAEAENKGIKIRINKVIKENDLLKIYVLYINKSGTSFYPCETNTVVVAGTTQYNYELSLNEYKMLNQLENGVEKEAILTFRGIFNDQCTIVFKTIVSDFRFTNIKIN